VPTQMALFPDMPAGVKPRAKRGGRKAKVSVTEDTVGEPVGAA